MFMRLLVPVGKSPKSDDRRRMSGLAKSWLAGAAIFVPLSELALALALDDCRLRVRLTPTAVLVVVG